MKNSRRFFSFRFALAAVLISGWNSCGTLSALEFPDPEWKTLFPGIEHAVIQVEEPLLKVNVLRIQTETPGLSFYSTGRISDYQADKAETDRRTVPDFLEENELAAAVNANFYTPFNAKTRKSRGPSDAKGLAVSDGVLVSPANGYVSFIVRKDGRCEVKVTQNDEPIDVVSQAVSGRPMLLENGQIPELTEPARHPRTLAAVSADGKTVWFVTIDGRQPGFSVGATFAECGEILKKLGADDGVNLDGGGSTTMAVRGEDGKPKVLNRPVGLGQPNSLRHNGNAIGVRVWDLEK
ncbi:MAG: phosphodiester glycosidase family protein [Planctomycetaceae bacterium]|nr:phosphodiester glycosidase family protein [Planctomycetaceae bacterium]